MTENQIKAQNSPAPDKTFSPTTRILMTNLLDQIIERMELELFGSDDLDKRSLFLLPFISKADNKVRGDAAVIFHIFNDHQLFKGKFRFTPVGIQKVDQSGSWTEVIQRLKQIKNELNGSTSAENGLSFQYSTGEIKSGAVVKHAFQVKYPAEIGPRRLSRAGQLFFQLFTKRAVADKKTSSEHKKGEPQNLNALMSLLNIEGKEEMRNLVNSIEKLIEEKGLSLKLLRSREGNAEMLLMAEEV